MCPGIKSASKKWVPGIPLGVKAAGAWDRRPTTLVVPNVNKSGALTYPDPLGPSRWPVVGQTFIFTYITIYQHNGDVSSENSTRSDVIYQLWGNKYSILCLYSCFRYPTRKSRPFCTVIILSLVWPVQLCLIISHYLINGMIFRKILPNIQREFWFSLQRLFGIFVILRRNSAMYHKFTHVFVWNIPFFMVRF